MSGCASSHPFGNTASSERPFGRRSISGSARGPGMMGGSRVRRAFVMRYGVDPKYARMTDPLQPTAENLRAGRQLYEQNCAACHGPQGFGNGPAGANLDPPPANLAGIGRMPMVTRTSPSRAQVTARVRVSRNASVSGM